MYVELVILIENYTLKQMKKDLKEGLNEVWWIQQGLNL